MERIVSLMASMTLVGLFAHASAQRAVLQDGLNGYAGTQDAQIRAGHADDNYAGSWEFALTNCNT